MHSRITIVVIVMSAFLAGCKIQVSAPEGGRVTTESGNLTCESGQPCLIDVQDGTFSETFLAEPAEGYSFSGWKNAGAHFCGDSLDPCPLSSAFFADPTPPGQAILDSEWLFYLEPVFERQASRPSLVSAGTYATRRSASDTGLNNLTELGSQLKSVDLNNDGYLDLVIPSGTFPPSAGCDCPPDPDGGEQPGVIMMNNGDNTFTLAEGDPLSSFWVSQVLTADFDGDGRTDVFLSDTGWDAEPFPGYQNQLLLNTEQGFIDATDRLPQLDDFSHNSGVGDIDGDGDTDLIVINDGFGDAPGRPYALINDGSANFTLERELLPDLWLDGFVYMPEGWEQYADGEGTVNFTTFAGTLADLDGDGLADLILGQVNYGGSAPSRIHWNMGGYYTDADVTVIPDLAPVFADAGVQTMDVQAGDLNGDGRVDLIIHGYRGTDLAGRTTQLMINQGNRLFTDESDDRLGLERTSTELGIGKHSLIDFNGDGALDIVIDTPIFYGGDSVAAWLNDGNGYFAPVLASEIFNGKTDSVFFGNENAPGLPLPHPSGLAFATFNKSWPDFDNNPDSYTFEINLLEELEPLVLRPGD